MYKQSLNNNKQFYRWLRKKPFFYPGSQMRMILIWRRRFYHTSYLFVKSYDKKMLHNLTFGLFSETFWDSWKKAEWFSLWEWFSFSADFITPHIWMSNHVTIFCNLIWHLVFFVHARYCIYIHYQNCRVTAADVIILIC